MKDTTHECAGFLKCSACGHYLMPCTVTASGIHPSYTGCMKPDHPEQAEPVEVSA